MAGGGCDEGGSRGQEDPSRLPLGATKQGELVAPISARPDRATVRFDTGRWTAKLALKERVPKIDLSEDRANERPGKGPPGRAANTLG